MKKLVPFLAVAICLIVTSGAAARVIPSLDTSLTNGKVDYNNAAEDGIDSSAETGAATLGAHADFNVDMRFSYGATGMDGFVEDPATYPAGSDYRETVNDIVVDIPPGLVGNPNAIPYEQRCDPSTFETSECPATATVGELWLKYSLIYNFGTPNALSINGLGPSSRTGYVNSNSGLTRVSLLKTDPEVPAKIGLFIRGPIGFGPLRTTLEIKPVSTTDLSLRTITLGGIPNTIINRNYLPEDPEYIQDYRLERMKLKLYGTLASGAKFMTSPTSCQPWTSKAWAHAEYVNDNLAADPLGSGANAFTAPVESTINPDCSNAAAVPFPITGNVAISSPDRDTSPSFDFTITNPGVQGQGELGSSTPRKVVTRIPASINVDVQQIGRTCPLANFYANTCPATSKVGSVAIETPLLRAGLTGNVYLVKRDPKAGLPDIGLYVTGAITFTQLASNQYTGEKFNQIETTFDDIPQVGFTKLTFHLDGGPDGLLRSLSCPSYNKAPALPNFTYNFTAWSGATATSTTPLNMKNCFGIQELKKYPRCLHKKLPIHPNYQSRSRLKSVALKLDKKRKGLATKRPFRFDVPIKKLKRGKHSFELKAIYDDGTVSKKTATFKKC